MQKNEIFFKELNLVITKSINSLIRDESHQIFLYAFGLLAREIKHLKKFR